MVVSFSHLLIKNKIHTVIAAQSPYTQCNLFFYYLKYVVAYFKNMRLNFFE